MSAPPSGGILVVVDMPLNDGYDMIPTADEPWCSIGVAWAGGLLCVCLVKLIVLFAWSCSALGRLEPKV